MSLIEPIPLRVFRYLASHWRTVAILAAILVIAIVAGLFRSCGGSKPLKIDEEANAKINSQNRAERIKELTTIVEDNSESISTVDNRSTIAETNVIERNAEVDAKVREANQKIEQMKAQGGNVTAKELECMLLENCQ